MMRVIVEPEPNNVNQIQGMRVFMRVIELNSFALAAKQLGMSAAAVTRSISMLEAHLNVRLINRSTRCLSLTEAGTLYLGGCRTIIENLDAIESNLVRSTRAPHGTLRIGAAATFASAQLCALLAAYHREQPLVDFDIRTFDAQVDMIDGGFDIGFTDSRRLPNSSLVSRVLVDFEDVLVASPAYLACKGSPTTPSMLGTHDLLIVSDGSARMWEFTDGAGSYRVQTLRNALRTSSHAMARTAAMNDMGIAMLPLPLIRDDLERGALVRLLELYPVNDSARSFSIVYSGRTLLTAKVRSFIDFSVNYFRPADLALPLLAVA
jgi:DNA-binding transcriptional LysR family regulator